MQQEQHQLCSASPYWWDSHKHSRPTHSQWLQSTLSDLDSKIKMIMDVIENDGDTFAKRAEMYYEKRPELIQMVQDLHKTCRALADKYGHNLKSAELSASIRALSNYNGSSNSFGRNITQPPLQDSVKKQNIPPTHDARIFRAESIEEYLASGSESGSTAGFDFHSPQDFMSVESRCSSNKLVNKDDIEALENGLLKENKMWEDQLKISKELEDNLSELVRRNEEKREMIIELQNENKFLKSCSNTTNNSSSKSFRKLKESRFLKSCSTTDYNNNNNNDNSKDKSMVKESTPRKGKFSLFCMP